MTSIEPGKYLITTTIGDHLRVLVSTYCNENAFDRDKAQMYLAFAVNFIDLNSMYKIYNYDGERLYVEIGKQKFYFYNDNGRVKLYPSGPSYPNTLNDNSIVTLNTDGTIKFKDGTFVVQNTNDILITDTDTKVIPRIFQFTKIDSNKNYLNKILEKFYDIGGGDWGEKSRIMACSSKDRDTKLNLYEYEPCQQEMKNKDFYKNVQGLYCQSYNNPELCECNPEIATYDFNTNTCKCDDKNLIYENGECVEPPKVDDNPEIKKAESPIAVVILIVAAVLLLLWYIKRK
jgi:hypothetical protein